MNVLGLGFTDHDVSAALAIDGQIVSGISRERLSRIKRDGRLWGGKHLNLDQNVQYILRHAKLAIDEIDLVVWSHIDHPEPDALYAELDRLAFLNPGKFKKCLAISHHFAHACSAALLNPLQDSAVLVIDGAGGPVRIPKSYAGPEVTQNGYLLQHLRPDQSLESREHESFYHYHSGAWELLRKIVGFCPFSGIGAEYGAASEILFGDPLEAGKTMGLAPYGRGVPALHFLKESQCEGPTAFVSSHDDQRDYYEDTIRTLLKQAAPIFDLELVRNYAATLQAETEQRLLTYIQWVKQRALCDRLSFTGGVALNCVANTRMLRDGGFRELFVPPAPGDDGIALGCALYGASLVGELRAAQSNVPFLGASYAPLDSDLEMPGVECLYAQVEVPWLATQLASGAVVAWFEGRSEIGPRALGHRSFLADPRRADMRARLNQVTKCRESFRPFAPIVLSEDYDRLFEFSVPSLYMSFVATVRTEYREFMTAATHVDGTARVQQLCAATNPRLAALLRAFGKITGVPALINTSFNRADEPLVESPADALRSFLVSDADFLVIDGRVYTRRPLCQA